MPEGRGLLALGERLHPTPAVGGDPRDVALALIDEHEGFDRGWYAGPIGWLGADGDGELCVALRCGIVDRTRATLFAGCGIVADSDPDPEWEESRIKLQAVISRARHPGGRRMSDARLLRAFVAELVAAGVTDAVVCPGSRSTPLALALRTAPGLRVRVLLDERAAGFFALGMARTSGRPVALLATSGTAAVEFHPAVVEAEQSRVPLVVLTRGPAARAARPRRAPDDRPGPPLRPAAKWYAELPLFDGDPATEAHVRSLAGRAVATAAAGPAGAGAAQRPVPRAAAARWAARSPRAAARPASTIRRRSLRPSPGGPPGRGARRGAGGAARRHAPGSSWRARTTTRPSPARSRRSPAPRASRSSPTRCPASGPGPHDRSMVVVRGDQLARRGPLLDAHRPDLVIRTGAMPTSKPILELLGGRGPGSSSSTGTAAGASRR